MPNSSTAKETNPKSALSKTLITSFLPRQLLINSNPKSINMNPSKDKTLLKCDSSQSRCILLHSISLFLEQNGFSKTLKNFRKESRIQKDDGEISSLDIEEICFEHLKSRKKGAESAENLVKTGENGVSDGKKSEQTIENGTVDVKSKKKKKSKSVDGASKQVIDETVSKPSEISVEAPLSLPSEPMKKSKDKRKHHKDEPEHLNKDIQETLSEVATETVEKKLKKEKKVKKEKKEKKEKNESKIMEEKATDLAAAPIGTIKVVEEKKESKKRKKPSAEENGVGHVEEAILDGSKRRKTDNSDQSNGLVQPPKTPNGSANGVLEDWGEKSQKQDKTKELNGSAEPRTAKAAFQRVKPEEVEFANERLQDNSYWAKDGADSGYGAKAQEVLGQVRGRDFRHEKTKKKRGSYRGGLIDLNTHSVKFNYEDEDE